MYAVHRSFFMAIFKYQRAPLTFGNGDYEMSELPLNATFSLGSTLSFLEKIGLVGSGIPFIIMLATWLWMGVDRSLPNQTSV